MYVGIKIFTQNVLRNYISTDWSPNIMYVQLRVIFKFYDDWFLLLFISILVRVRSIGVE